jgi:hypothetical protein
LDPDYKILFNKTNIENNIASHSNDYKIPVFTFEPISIKKDLKNVDIKPKDFSRGYLAR